jgi:hypothetical protein
MPQGTQLQEGQGELYLVANTTSDSSISNDRFYRRKGKQREDYDYAFRTKSVNFWKHFTTKIFANDFVDNEPLGQYS